MMLKLDVFVANCATFHDEWLSTRKVYDIISHIQDFSHFISVAEYTVNALENIIHIPKLAHNLHRVVNDENKRRNRKTEDWLTNDKEDSDNRDNTGIYNIETHIALHLSTHLRKTCVHSCTRKVCVTMTLMRFATVRFD